MNGRSVKIILALAVFFITNASLFADEEKASKESCCIPQERAVATTHTLTIGSETIPYTATAGTLVLKDDKDKPKASFFYVAYVRDDIKGDRSNRPVTFCFNGGPGSSSIWLHMGAFGPKRVLIGEGGNTEPSYKYADNEYSLLDVTDLVFIDPISTGYSRAAPGEDEKQFHSVKEDVKSVAEFIRLYVTKNQRWESPKFIAGESYGTLRAAGLYTELNERYRMPVNGVILISSVLDFQTLRSSVGGNDLPHILYLPSQTAAAWYHQKLPEKYQKLSLTDVIKKSEEFASHDYATALFLGRRLEINKRKEIAKSLSEFTGLSQDYIERLDLRIKGFSTTLLRAENLVVGRFDSRFAGFNTNPACNYMEYDPSADIIFGAYTAAFNDYIRADLKWEQDENYEVLSTATHKNWDFGEATNEYLNVAENLRDGIVRNPRLQIFVGSGYYDLATPYFGSDYTFNHLGLDSSLDDRVTMKYYDAGHMMYIHRPSHKKLKEDLKAYFNRSITEKIPFRTQR